MVGLSVAAVVEIGPLPLESSLVGIGRVARTIYRLWETSLSSGGSLGAVGGLVVSGATPLVVSFFFSATLTCFTSLGGLLEEEGALAGETCLGFGSWGVVSALEPGELDARMSGG